MKRVKILCMHEPAHLVGWVTRESGPLVVTWRSLVTDVSGPHRSKRLDGRFVEGTHPLTGEPVERYHLVAEAKCEAGGSCWLSCDDVLAAVKRGDDVVRVPFFEGPV